MNTATRVSRDATRWVSTAARDRKGKSRMAAGRNAMGRPRGAADEGSTEELSSSAHQPDQEGGHN